ncbi:MAG TPA: response regulator [Verrucomicrobiae bacterium]|nr:response regulator [Verrucomicrobiae bacterium]
MSNLILLAEDSYDDALFFKRALKKAGVQNPVHVVSDGAQAIAYILGDGFYADRERFPEPSIVFLDLIMPRADGWVVLNWLSTQANKYNLFVIVMTGAGEISQMGDAYSMGAHSFVFKPIQAAEIKALIEYWPARWMLKGKQNKRATAVPTQTAIENLRKSAGREKSC